MEKLRLDKLLVELKLAPSRHKAEALILAGSVLVNDRVVDKCGTAIPVDAEIRIRGKVSRFVGRGGEKIDAALTHFSLDVSGLICLDVGASTGGFTDALLQRGALQVYAVDVGYNQLDYSLRVNEQVVVMERTNAKKLQAEMFDPLPSFASLDVSFIGLRKVLSPVVSVLESPFSLLALVKPQFELGPEFVEKGGVVRSEEHRQAAVELVREYGSGIGLSFQGSMPSPLKGEKKGNQEYFVYFRNEDAN